VTKRFRDEQYRVAIHEAGHAVVAHLVGIAIDHVTIVPKAGAAGYSRPVRDPVAATADKLWAEATAIRRKLLVSWADVKEGADAKLVYVLRKSARRLKKNYWKVRGTPAPQELVDRMELLRKRAHAMWKKSRARATREDHIKDLMHTLGGPVADAVFFNEPFEAPRNRLLTKAELKARGMEHLYGCARKIVGNYEAGTDFRLIRNALKHINNANWKEAREFYRRKAERLVRRHRATIERVAKALLRHKTLTGAELAKLIKASPTKLKQQ
jgi:ATP-dependent Zn protease